MPFGFFSSEFSDQGTMDDGKAGSTILLMSANITAFAILYTIGNVISMLSLTFIIGLKKQFKTMFAPVRFWATVIYLGLLIATLILSLTVKLWILSLVLVLVQFCALVWYS
ncbi:Got1/Sft2-like family-domain-containing protein [Thamnidium elegans]|nr:Got1/Sft2-like family-domain-containing protein [Thamnidium elegans]